MEYLYSVLDAISTTEGNLAIVWRYLGLRWLAKKLLSRRHRVMAAGLRFFADRPALQQVRSLKQFFQSVDEVDACWVIGYTAFQEGTYAHKIKRLLLPHPESASLQFYSDVMVQPQNEKHIRLITEDAERHNIDVRWCPEFIGCSMMLADRDSERKALVHVEYAIPGMLNDDRPSVAVYKKNFPTVFKTFQDTFDSLWRNSVEPGSQRLLSAGQAETTTTDHAELFRIVDAELNYSLLNKDEPQLCVTLTAINASTCPVYIRKPSGNYRCGSDEFSGQIDLRWENKNVLQGESVTFSVVQWISKSAAKKIIEGENAEHIVVSLRHIELTAKSLDPVTLTLIKVFNVGLADTLQFSRKARWRSSPTYLEQEQGS